MPGLTIMDVFDFIEIEIIFLAADHPFSSFFILTSWAINSGQLRSIVRSPVN